MNVNLEYVKHFITPRFVTGFVAIDLIGQSIQEMVDEVISKGKL